jgi:hypothetical protein
LIGSQVHLFRKSGDVDILVRTIPEVQALMGSLASVGVRTV